MAAFALHEIIRAQNDRGPHRAGLGCVSGSEMCSYARARQRLTLLFARRLWTASTTLRAAGAAAFANIVTVVIMRQLHQNGRPNASTRLPCAANRTKFCP